MTVPTNGGFNRALLITYLNIVLYALCYNLQRPVEPFLVEELSKNSDTVELEYGKLQSFFSAIQTIGSPIVGTLLDRIGLRQSSMMVFGSSALSYYILSYATTMNVLFYSKIPTILQHAFIVAQAVATTSCESETHRAQALGRMTTAYLVGATLGPVLGGHLARTGDLYWGARLAVAGSLLSVALSVLLPNTKREAKRTTSFFDDMRHALAIGVRPQLWKLLSVKVISGVASSMFQTTLPLILTQHLNFDPSDLGLSMSISTLASAIFGAVGMGFLTQRLGSSNAMAHLGLAVRPMLGGIMASIVLSSISHKFPWIVGCSVLHGLATHAVATGVTTQTTGMVQNDEQGALLGLEHSLFSLARIGGPRFGTSLLTATHFGVVASVCGAIDLLNIGILWSNHVKSKGT